MPKRIFANIIDTDMRKINVDENIINTLAKLAFMPPYDNTLYNFLSFVFEAKIKSIEKRNITIDEKRNIDLLYVHTPQKHYIFSFALFPYDIANIIEYKYDTEIAKWKIAKFIKMLLKEEFP